MTILDFSTDLELTLITALAPFALRGALSDGLADAMLKEIQLLCHEAIQEVCERHEVR